MEYPTFKLENELEKELYDYLKALNVAVREKQDGIEDRLSPAMKEARELMRNDPYYSLFHIPSESFHRQKKDWNSFLGKRFETMIGIILKPYVPDPPPEEFILPGKRQLCDYPAIFGDQKCALEVKNRFGTAERKVHDSYLEMFDQIKEIEDGSWEPIMLIRMTDNNPTAIKKWTAKGWIIYQGEEMYDFIKTHTDFDLPEFLDRIELPRIRKKPDTGESISESYPRKTDQRDPKTT